MLYTIFFIYTVNVHTIVYEDINVIEVKELAFK